MQNKACHVLAISDDVSFKIVTGVGDQDPISEQIQKGTLTFCPAFKLGFALMHAGDIVLDLGAHVGTFALAAAALGCRVVAVDASPYNISLLEDSVAQNGYEQLRVISAAVSDHTGTLAFIQAGPFGLVATPRIESPTIDVPAVTVDELLRELGLDQVDLIKMDIEGSEIAALRGMSRLLNGANAPKILYESNGFTLSMFDQNPKHLITALAEFGYDNYMIEAGQLVPVDVDDLQADCVVDYLAVKPPFVPPQGWCITPPLSLKQTISRVVAACRHPNEHHRMYTARVLADANDTILNNRKVKHALNLLKEDPHPDVRAAISWWSGTNPMLERSVLAKEIEAHSDIMLRGYTVRSHIPLLGPFIAWVRRNLTSHLREPYLDPTLERQVEVNRRVAEWLHRAAQALAAAAQRQAELEDRVRVLEAQVRRLAPDAPVEEEET